MFWWWFMPEIHWPLSGGVTQDIRPGWLLESAGNARTEQRIVGEVASYGRQLGVLSDLVLGLAGEDTRAGWSEERVEAYEKLKNFVARADEIKAEERSKMIAALTAREADSLVTAIQSMYPDAGAKASSLP